MTILDFISLRLRSDTRIGQAGAFFAGLPSVFNAYLFYVLAGLLGVFVFWPIPAGLWHRLRFGAWPKRRSRRLAVKRFICLLMAFVFLAGPESFLTLSRAQIQYSDLSAAAWGNTGDTITYEYDENGSLTSKETNNSGVDTEDITYEYNLQNRMSRVITDNTPGITTDAVEVVDYTYNTSGIRTQKYTYDTDDGGTTKTNEVTTDYLIDPYNHTGYAQVLEETTDDGTTTLTRIHYTIGDDVISQTESTSTDSGVNWTAGDPQYLLYDGHGSTRQLLDHAYTEEAVTLRPIAVDNYSYDGYGVMLSDGSGADAAANAGTSMLYADEQYDSAASMYYNRARYYNPANGLFNRTDSYSGNTQDPQSLHKYAYCHANPVNAIDPTGMMGFSLSGLMSTFSIIGTIMSIVAPPIIGIIGTNRIRNVDREPDAFVVSFSASYIFPLFNIGFGFGFEGTYDLLWINALGRWVDYWAPGISLGYKGGSLTVEAGPVWNVKKVSDYEKMFISTTIGSTMFDGFLGPFNGIAGSIFLAPGQNSAFGAKFGGLTTSPGSVVYSSTVSWYFSGGPVQDCRLIKRWFNDNIDVPPMDTPQDIERFMRRLMGMPEFW